MSKQFEVHARDMRLTCKLCQRVFPNYCKRHAPTIIVAREKYITVAASQADQVALLERLKLAIDLSIIAGSPKDTLRLETVQQMLETELAALRKGAK